MATQEQKMDYENILSPHQVSGQVDGLDYTLVFYNDAIRAMKEAVSQAVKIVLSEAAKKASCRVEQSPDKIYIFANVNKDSILSLATDEDLRKKLGLSK